MKKVIMAFIAYSVTGIGVYHTFLGDSNLFGLIILVIGLLGVMNDTFYRNVKTE
ncbi:hypothetical protein [Pontibacillus salipaludis]|uniref:hypothetical protein n=1 Tax=Pontibacillus salipaludis TaxID=1697394 RepID=UPI0031EF13C2